MELCELCYYFYQPGTRKHEGAHGLCTVCALRTTREARLGYMRGQRIAHPYMDSD
jgi:hypothetical protein